MDLNIKMRKNPKDIIDKRTGEVVLYHGFCGNITLNKYYYNGHMYALIRPVISENVNIYAYKEFGRWYFCLDYMREFNHISTWMYVNGIHYDSICTGRLRYNRKCSEKRARELCAVVAKQLEMCNSPHDCTYKRFKKMYGLRRIL